MAYDKNLDYQALIQQAAAKNDYKTAALLEQQRNEKIKTEKLNYAQTNDYAGNLDETDYATILQQQMKDGASGETVKETLNKRVNKANSAVNLKQHVNDELYNTAMDYIAKGAGSFSYDKAPEYVSQYKDKIDSLFNEIVNGNYNEFLGTPDYAALEGQHQRLGQRAMQDAIGDVSARTGGLASSYAVTAGQEAYGNQMSALEQAAMDMYSNQKTDKMNQLGLLSGLENDSYNKHLGSLNQYNNDRAFDYQTEQDNKATQTSNADSLAAIGNFTGYVKLGVMTQDEALKAQTAWAVAHPNVALKLYPELSAKLGLVAPVAGGSGGGGKHSGGSNNDAGGGTRNNSYAFSQVQKMLKSGWTTTQLGQFLREQLKAGKINQYTFDQSMSAIYVDAGKRRRNK
ncbi:MAG: hypothetical protein RR394_04370 [Oscillospiraceae bacterium]